MATLSPKVRSWRRCALFCRRRGKLCCRQIPPPWFATRGAHVFAAAPTWPVGSWIDSVSGHDPRAGLVPALVSPFAEEDFLYAGKFKGEAGRLLEAVGISTAGKSAETVLGEFQRGGFLLAHVLECPLETGLAGESSCEDLLMRRVAAVATRIRRSLKPKRVVLISELLAPVAARLSNAELGCPVILDDGKPFGLDSSDLSEASQNLRQALGLTAAGM